MTQHTEIGTRLGAPPKGEGERMGVSGRIREVAEHKYLTLKALSSDLDVSYRTVQNYLSGERTVGAVNALLERSF